MTKILVTGGSGFIGTNLVDKCIEDGHEVLNIDIAKPQKKEHFDFWRQVDILKYETLEKECKKFEPEVIVHLAAVTDLNGQTLEYYKTNTDGTRNVVQISDEVSSIKKVIFTSSMYVCKPGYIPKNYDDYKPHTLYGESKVEGEKIVKTSGNLNYSWVIVRPTSIWGPWFHIPYIDFFNIVYQGRYFDFGDTCTKTYGYVENTVFQIQKLIMAGNVHAKTFYLGDYPPIQISEWANEISLEMRKGRIRKIPYFLMKTAAFAGDVLLKFNIKFPMTSFRLSNMTTDNILPLDDLYSVTGPTPKKRIEGVRETIKWLVESRGYKVEIK